jgi:hypothetical protein
MAMMLTGLGDVAPEAVAAGCTTGFGGFPRNGMKVRSARLDAYGLHVVVDGTISGDLILRTFVSKRGPTGGEHGLIMLARQTDVQAAITGQYGIMSSSQSAGAPTSSGQMLQVQVQAAEGEVVASGSAFTPGYKAPSAPATQTQGALRVQTPARPKVGLGAAAATGDARYRADLAAIAKLEAQLKAAQEAAVRCQPASACGPARLVVSSLQQQVARAKAAAEQNLMERQRRDERLREQEQADAIAQDAARQQYAANQAAWAAEAERKQVEADQAAGQGHAGAAADPGPLVSGLKYPDPKAYRVGAGGELLLPIEELPASSALLLTG